MERRSIAAEIAAKRGAAHDVLRLTAIAHPNLRDELTAEARTIG